MIRMTNKVGKSGCGITSQMRDNCLALEVALWELQSVDGAGDAQCLEAVELIVKQISKDAKVLRKWLME